jgi:hypothetical protein
MTRSSLLRLLVVLATATAGLFAFTGCQSTAQDSSVPWSRPASWEGTLPGIGSGGP